jgi:hypothetical protein
VKNGNVTVLVLVNTVSLVHTQSLISTVTVTKVTDPRHVNADPGPGFHFNADPDRAFHLKLNADPHQSDGPPL